MPGGLKSTAVFGARAYLASHLLFTTDLSNYREDVSAKNSTSALHQHQRTCSGKDLCRTTGNSLGLTAANLLPSLQTTLAIGSSGGIQVQKPFDAEHFLQLTARWVCASDQPFTSVESKELRVMVTYLQPTAKLPSATTIRRVVGDLFGRYRAMVSDFLEVRLFLPTLLAHLLINSNLFSLVGQ